MAIRVKNFFSFLSIVAISLACLSSCNFFSDIINGGGSENVIETPSNTINSDGTKSWTSNINNAKMLSYQGISALSSTGEQKILVIPVAFNSVFYDGFSSRGGISFPTAKDKTYKETICDAFFGESMDTGWESVKSFYNKSSYGKLNLTGEVMDAVTINHPLSYYSAQVTAGRDLNDVINDLTCTIFGFIEDREIDLSSYDQDNDGIVDAVWFVYNENSISGSDLAWAFTTTNQASQNWTDYKLGTFSWASYWFLNEANYADNDGNFLPDAHTFIHETGHILGLDDYYSYDRLSYAPVGGMDMMDYNIGDHMALSKYLLNWIDPKEIITPGTYNLSPFESSGEAFIIGNNYNGTAFDEYLIMEYYTPTALNLLDATRGYTNRSKMFSVGGLRIYHVDTRLGFIDSQENWNGAYIENITCYATRSEYMCIIASNTPSKCIGNQSYHYVELVSQRSGGDLKTKNADNDDLYLAGDTLTNYVFNDSSSLAFTISVGELTADGLTLTIA